MLSKNVDSSWRDEGTPSGIHECGTPPRVARPVRSLHHKWSWITEGNQDENEPLCQDQAT